MTRAERFFVYAAAAVALAAGLGSLTVDRTAVASRQSSDHATATVNVLGLMQEMLQTGSYLPERERVAAEFTGQIEAAEGELQRLQNEIQLVGQQAPNAGQLRQQYQMTAQRLQQLGNQATQAFQELTARQAIDAYAAVAAAVDKVAAEGNYRTVFASNRDPAIAAANNLTAVTQEILARPVLYGTDVDDLTAIVRDELGLPQPADTDADAGNGPASDD